MYKNHKIVVVTPSGRKKYQEILFHYLTKQLDIIDEYRIWVNTHCKFNRDWFRSLAIENSWVTLDIRQKAGGNHNINQFFNKCIDENTIYIRLDDDIVYLDPDFIKNIVDFRIENPEYFLILGNIINNSICTFLHREKNIIDVNFDMNFYAMNQLWHNPDYARTIHEIFINDLKNHDTNKYKTINNHVMKFYKRFSINAICWFGHKFKTFNGIVHGDEEQYLTEIYTKKTKTPNIICSNALCSHLSFRPQRSFVANSSILADYRSLLR